MEQFLEELSSVNPTPGGGSVAALSGAMGAALVLMLMALSQKKVDQELRDRFLEISEETEILKATLIELVDKDAESFQKVMEAYKLPKNNEEEKRIRSTIIQKSFKEAAKIPLLVMEKCLEVAKFAVEGIEKGNPNAVTDGGVAVLNTWAGLKGAALNVEINLMSIKDQDFVESSKKQVQEMIKEADSILFNAENQIKIKLDL